MNQDCTFCRLDRLGESDAFQTLFPRPSKCGEILYEEPDLYVILDAAPLVTGHCLIVPKRHVLSVASVWKDIWRQVYNARNFIEERFRTALNCKPIYFEHGASVSYEHSCVEHAHIHAIPSEGPIIDAVKRQGIAMTPMPGGYNDLRPSKWKVQYYMLTDHGGKAYFVSEQRLPSQLIRRIFAEQHSLRAWNWQDFVQMAMALETRTRIQSGARKLT